MKSVYMELGINDVELDFDNPRIAKYLEQYGRDELTSEAISLALGGGTDDLSGTSYNSLKESIKANQGIIHPIIVNKIENGRYVVVEGNTRVQIYKEFKEANLSGNWDTIKSIVYDNLSDCEIHAIRLQSHLVGPRDWDPYSKAKYLNYLSNQEKLPLSQIISFCGGKSTEVKKLIDAYNDMEKYYKDNLDDDSEFDQRDFSKFVELQNKAVKEALLICKFDRNDFAKWVIKGNIDTAQNIRKLPAILKNPEARKAFLKINISEAWKVLAIEEADLSSLKDVPYEVLAAELARKLRHIEYNEINNLKNDPRCSEKRETLFDLLYEFNIVIDAIKED